MTGLSSNIGKSIVLPVFAAALLTGCSGEEAAPSNPVATTAAETTPIEKPAASFTEEVISAGALSGLFIKTEETAPIVLIVPGSGPTDLNGNNRGGGQSNAYKYLAEQLAEQGISTVRVDKRGMFSSAGPGDGNKVSVDIYAEDYRSWVKAIQAQTSAPCVYLLGHSEGATMVSAAAIDNPNVCGLILVAGAGRPLGDILREQLKSNPANVLLLKQAFAAIDALETGKPVDYENLNPALNSLFSPLIEDFWRSVMPVDPADLARQAAQKTLVVQGDVDLQIKVEDAELLAAASGGQLSILKGVNHVLKESSSIRALNYATYNNPDLPVAEEVITVISEFVNAQE